MSGGQMMLNGTEDAVDDCLAGIVAASNSNLVLLSNRRVIVRADIQEKLKGKVAVVSGGGSGHEPAFAGYVGQGMLTASCSGSIFASPPVDSILAMILTVARYASTVLILVMNYTGDRLNFGLALERAKSRGIKCEILVVSEDCALLDVKARRRGLAGSVLVAKIAGAMSEADKTLEEIVDYLKTHVLSDNKLGTIGLSLSAVVVPGRTSASFELGSDQMELGLGIHGESGAKRLKVLSAKDSVKQMLHQMTKKHLVLKQDERIVLLVNNLGGLSNLELGVVVKEVTEILTEKSLKLERIYLGSFMTSLRMAGFSLSILKIRANSSDLLKYLDAPASCLGWNGGAPAPNGSSHSITDPLLATTTKTQRKTVSLTSKVAIEAFETALKFACEALISCERQLNIMDTGSGDGDTGSTLRRGAEKILKLIEGEKIDFSDPISVLRELSISACNEMGGTSGALYSIFFTAAANYLEEQKKLNFESWGLAAEAGLKGIMKYGGASKGDRTMIDALEPAIKILTADKKPEGDPISVLGTATSAAEEGANETLEIHKALAGRAAYVPEVELKHPDPGAHAVGIIMRAVNEGVKLKFITE